MEPYITGGLATLGGILGGAFGGYLAGYMNKKGENLATHEDIDKLVEQVRAVTTTTKEIEAQISGGLWDRQKRWELKRDVLFEASKRTSEIMDALLEIQLLMATEIKNNNYVDSANKGLVTRVGKRWIQAQNALNGTKQLVATVCGEDVSGALYDFHAFAHEVSVEIFDGDLQIYQNSRNDLAKKHDAITIAIREELGIDAPAKR